MGKNQKSTSLSYRVLIPFVLFIFLTCLLLQIYLYHHRFYSISADESGRTLTVVRILKQPSQIFTPQIWLPLYHIIHAIGLRIYYDLFLTPRIVSGIFGFGAVLALMLFSHALFHQKEITILSGLLGSFFPHRIILSAVPLSEIIFIFFITVGLTFFIKWINSFERELLFLASTGFALASAVRYEGWSFIIIMFLILCYYRFYQKKLDWKQYLIATLILGIFPFYWLTTIFVTGQLQVLGAASDRFLLYLQGNPIEVWKKNFIHQFIKESLLTFHFLAPIALIAFTLSHKKFRFLAFLIFGSLLLMTLISQLQKSLPSHNWWRLAFPSLFLLLPFLAFLIFRLSHIVTSKKMSQLVVMIITVMIFTVLFLNYTFHKTQWSHFTVEDRAVGKFIKNRELNLSQNILIDSSVWNYLNVMIASNRTDQFILLNGKDPLKTDHVRQNNLVEHFHEMVYQYNISMILLWDKNKKYRELKSELNSFDQYEFGQWHLWDISLVQIHKP